MNIALYCSACDDLPAAINDLAHRLGQWIGAHGHTLVYGGVKAGLMHIAAQATRDAGGTVYGVVPQRFAHRADPLCHHTELTTDLAERKARMIALADAFVVLPGGIGTLDEWISTTSQLSVMGEQKPIVVVDPKGIFTHTVSQLRAIAESIVGTGRNIIIPRYVTNADEMISQLHTLNK